jgi:hypothetical protein
MAHGTVEYLLDEGFIAPRDRTTADDLELAATWLEAYEGDTDDDYPGLTTMATVAQYLRNQASQRRKRAQHRTGVAADPTAL